jgi:Flp pilus assembly pilin Flp
MRIKGGCTALASFIADESGQDIVEYALLTALIGVASILTWKLLADTVQEAYGEVDAETQALAPPPDPIVPE